MKRRKKQVNNHSVRKKRLIMVLGIVFLWLLVLTGAFWFFVMENIADHVTVEAGGDSVEAQDFLLRDWDIPVEFVTELSALDMKKPGDYPLQIRYMNRTYDTILRVRDTLGPEVKVRSLTTLSIYTPEPEEFLSDVTDVSSVTVEYEVPPDMNREGVQMISLLVTDAWGNATSCQAELTVIFDKEAPVIQGTQPLRVFRGWEVDYLRGITITDDQDEMPVLEVDDSDVDLNVGGEYTLTYIGRDASGNENRVPVQLTLIVDEEPPTVWGVQPISLYAGSTISYRSGIVVVDDVDENPKLKIDSSGVDLSKAGIYEVIYIATDEAGNETRTVASVTVKEKKGNYVPEETIYAMADELLAKIITDGMTNKEKVEAVYNYITRHYSYYGASDKTDSMQAAYTIMRTHMGDCFNFYAVSKLLLDRLGIPNITVLRGENPYRSTRHYWSLVSIDGGENYYHFDTTPHTYNYYKFCLVTDAYLDEFSSKVFRGYYARDMSLYPATPEEPPA